MIKSLYLRLFFLGIPGLYLALMLSRFSLSMVNAVPYYYGMIIIAMSIFSGILTGYTAYNPFRKFFARNNLLIMLATFAFLNIGHIFNWMDAGIDAKFEVIYYFTGIYLTGFICSLYMQFNVRNERNTMLWAFVIGSILSYFIGIKYFEQSHLDLFLGIPVFVICLLDQIFISPYRTWFKIISVFLLAVINVLIVTIIHLETAADSDNLNNLGYNKIVSQNGRFFIIDHRRNRINNIKDASLANINDLPVFQLQTNKKKNHVLFIGYPGSLTPFFLHRSPFVEKLDLYFWGIIASEKFLKPTVFPDIFYRAEWNFFNKFKLKKYDMIIIENIPNESESSRRIFLHYARRMLKQPHGIIAYPEKLARKYDGQYIKVNHDSSMVMLMGGESTENTAELEKRFDKFLKETTQIPEHYRSRHSLPKKLISKFDSKNTLASHDDVKISTVISRNAMNLILWFTVAAYLIFRLFKCRYKNNQNLFFAFEAGFTLSVILFASLMLLSELRLVYPYFTPALFGISVMTMLPLGSKKSSFIFQIALLGLLFYFSSIEFVRTLPPIYVVPLIMPLSFIAIANTLNKCKVRNKITLADPPQIFFLTGVLVTLLLIICVRNNNLYPTLIYTAIISRFLYYLKI